MINLKPLHIAWLLLKSWMELARAKLLCCSHCEYKDSYLNYFFYTECWFFSSVSYWVRRFIINVSFFNSLLKNYRFFPSVTYWVRRFFLSTHSVSSFFSTYLLGLKCWVYQSPLLFLLKVLLRLESFSLIDLSRFFLQLLSRLVIFFTKIQWLCFY